MSTDSLDLEVHRAALTGHCYRMLGSAFDADDAVQQTMLRAWRHRGQFDARASLRTWLYRIATNVCLDEFRDRKRRALPVEEGAPSAGTTSLESLVRRDGGYWIEPMADARIVPSDADPAERAMLRQSIRLAFVAALQNLAPKQRAVLLLVDVLGCSAAEAAETLDSSVAAVNSALQRARAVMGKYPAPAPAELSKDQEALVGRYVVAFERYDMEGLMAVMREDATLCMPPYTLWLQGRAEIRDWMIGSGCRCRGSRLRPVAACGSAAFAQYRSDPENGYKAWALVVLDMGEDVIAGVTTFLEVEKLFPVYGLPLTISA